LTQIEKGGYVTMTMKRMNFYLADSQIKRLKAIQKKTGLPLSDILRRAIDEYWERFEKKSKK
jgi:predicted DNA-binding protein